MSLDRFSNKDQILDQNGVVTVNKWPLEITEQKILLTKSVESADLVNASAHLYSKDQEGEHVTSTYNLPLTQEGIVPEVAIDVAALAQQVQIRTGRYHVVFNFHEDLAGDYENPVFYVDEISADRRELYLKNILGAPQALRNIRDEYVTNAMILEYLQTGNLVANFGRGITHTVVNQAHFDEGLIIKLLSPLDESLVEGATIWMSYERADPISDDIEFYYVEDEGVVTIAGPNFESDLHYNTITETAFANWNELLGSTTSTSQQIVDKMFSGSLAGVKLGIDYSGFQNFIHFSSATERLKNFKYKLELIEFYNAQINTLNDALGSESGSLQNNVTLNRSRRDQVLGTFDGFERWLYNEPTSSLFTHQAIYDQEHRKGNPTRLEGGLLGSDTYQITPYPKFISSSFGTGEYVVHHTTSSIATTWYNGLLSSASLYDSLNDKSLQSTIPEHIRTDSNNDQYELFVNMIGHHFDILYSYADAIANTYHAVEHPKLGHSKEVLYEIAKSLGWNLANGNQASQLWQYKLGVNKSGSYASTGSIFSKADEEITTEVWRRIVNNLSYLLKTKGTSRSIKALMNTYGIPQTLLSIREYGGPKVEEDVPLLIEDRFSYALQFNEGAKIEWQASHIDLGSHPNTVGWLPGTKFSGDVPPITREFRW